MAFLDQLKYLLVERLDDRWVEAVQGDESTVEIFKNPNQFDILKINKYNTRLYKLPLYIRAWVDNYGKGNIYSWAGEAASHKTIRSGSTKMKPTFIKDPDSMIPIYIESARDTEPGEHLMIYPSTFSYPQFIKMDKDQEKQIVNNLKSNPKLNNLKNNTISYGEWQ